MLKKIRKIPTVLSLLGLSSLAAVGCQSSQIVDEERTVIGSEPADLFAADRTADLWVKGVTCPFCVQNIDQRISKVNGVDGVHVDLKSGHVRVLLSQQSPASREDLVSAIDTSGFTLDRIEMP
ncbi:MAG: heavy-metal-associated domain-containing protein [Phycisphaerales bacterium]|nr:heavy-metal-associated domain-containing protein [Phycisphaerales bacterium]